MSLRDECIWMPQICRSGSHCLVWRNKRFVSSNYKANPLAARRRERFSSRSVFANHICSHHAEILADYRVARLFRDVELFSSSRQPQPFAVSISRSRDCVIPLNELPKTFSSSENPIFSSSSALSYREIFSPKRIDKHCDKFWPAKINNSKGGWGVSEANWPRAYGTRIPFLGAIDLLM